MIPTPEFAVNPLSWKETATFDPGDGIPIEKASGFGRHIKRDAIKRGIVMDYAEVSGNITIDVTSRNSDLYLRYIGGSVGTITIYGQLPAGNTLYIDPITRGCNAIVGGVTYNLTGTRRGVAAFHSTGSGWSRPSQTMYNADVRNDLSVSNSAAIGNDLTVNDQITVGSYHYPGLYYTSYIVNLAVGATAVLPRGVLTVKYEVEPSSDEYSTLCSLQRRNFSAWEDVASFGNIWKVVDYLQSRFYITQTIFSNGSNYRFRNIRSSAWSYQYFKQ